MMVFLSSHRFCLNSLICSEECIVIKGKFRHIYISKRVDMSRGVILWSKIL